jgi:Zn-dependent protease
VIGGDPVVFLVGCLFLIPALVIAIPVHELGHAIAANAMGDPVPRNRGFLRPDPRQYLNVYGVIAVFLANVGWGTPAPINEYRLRGVGGRVIYALAGPAANLVAAVVFGILVRVLLAMGLPPNPFTLAQPPAGLLSSVCYAIFFLNLSIFAFQLLPVPGLDGWRVIEALFRSRNPRFFFNVAANVQTIWIVCAVIIFFGPYLLHFGILDAVVGIFFQPVSTAILGQCVGYVSLHPCPLSGRF